MIRLAPAILMLLAALHGAAAAWACAACLPPNPTATLPLNRGTPAPIQTAVIGEPGEGDLPACCGDWRARIVGMNGYRRVPVVSAWLSNGVRLHHLHMESVPGAVFVTVSFSGGELLESPANRGISLGACSAWDGLSVAGDMPARVPAALEGRDVSLEAMAGPDSIQLRIRARREDIDEGMRAASAMLSRPRVTEGTLATTMKQGCEMVEARSRVLAPMVADAIGEAIFPAGECRARPMRSEQGARITVDAAQQWLERHITSSPVEVSIVGDLTLEEAMRLGAGYLGRLPPRDRPGPEHFADARRIPRPAYPIRAEVVRDIDPGAAIVVAGFPGADAPDTRALRTLRVAARVLDQRATDALQDAGFEEVEVGCAAMAGTIYPGFGVVVANVKVDAARAEQAADVIEGVIHHMAADGVSAPEVAQAAQELTRVVERYEKEPQYWASILARAESTGLDPDLVAEGANFYRGITAEAVSDTVRRSVGQGRTLRLIIRGSTPGVEAGGK